jgi:hypothetical protein
LRTRYEEKLHHAIVDVKHFIERELLVLLEESHHFRDKRVSLQNIQVACNSIRITLACEDSDNGPLVLAFQEQSSWLMVGILEPGWIVELKDWHRRTLQLAIAGFYKLAGVDIVREQLRGCFAPGLPPYDVTDKGLVVWPDGRYESEVRYDLTARPWMRPRPRPLARQYDLPTLEANHALYGELHISWDTWVACWEAEESTGAMPDLFPHEVNLLPSKYLVRPAYLADFAITHLTPRPAYSSAAPPAYALGKQSPRPRPWFQSRGPKGRRCPQSSRRRPAGSRRPL